MADHLFIKKTNKTMADQQNVDRISNLPDLALGVIVSFLPFKEAGRTCVLSKRWEGIWRFAISNMERFDEYILYNPLPTTKSSPKREIYVTRRRVFLDFVKTYVVLANRYPSPEEMDSFYFSFYNPDDFKPDVDWLIKYVISKNVKDLDLDFSSRMWKNHRADRHTPSFELPETFYQHELFVSLKLSACNVRVPYLSNLRGLRNLSLGWIELRPSDIQSLLTNCELLESLSLSKCRKLGVIDISLTDSSRLTSFVIDDCSSLWDVLLVIPTLRYFKYFGTLSPTFYLEELRDIEEADFDFTAETEYDDFGDNIVNIIHQIRHLRVLTVCSYITKVIASANFETLSMPDLRHLMINTGLTDDDELLGVSHLFRSCPDLEILTIRLETLENVTDLTSYEVAYSFTPKTIWRMNGIYIPCLRTKLREVRIEGVVRQTCHFEIIHYLLVEGSVLERVTIVPPWMKMKFEKLEDKEKFKQSLLNFISEVNKASENVLTEVI